MNTKELRKLNDLSMQNFREYKQNFSKLDSENAKNYDINKFYTAKQLFNEVHKYNTIFDVNAIDFAEKLKNELIAKNPELKQNNFSLGITIKNINEYDIEDAFNKSHRKEFIYELVLKNNDFNNYFEIPLLQNKYGITSTDEKDFNFNEAKAFERFKSQNINLIDNRIFHIATQDNCEPCEAIEKYDLNNFLWSVVEEQVEVKKSQKQQQIKDKINELTKQEQNLSENNLENLL